MATKTFVRQGGTWNEASNILVKQNGEWINIQTAWVKEGGQWLQFFGQSLTAPPPVIAPPVIIKNSLLFETSKSQFMQRTFGTAVDSNKWTWSGWTKRAKTGTALPQTLFSTAIAGGGVTQDVMHIRFEANDQLSARGELNNAPVWFINSTQTFVDDNAWYNVVIQFDSSNVTASERLKMFVNNQRITDFSATNFPTLNESGLNIPGPSRYGSSDASGGPFQIFDGYQAEDIFVDGEVLDPTSFGQFVDKIWTPIDFVGAFGNNGHLLNHQKNEIKDNITTSVGSVGGDTPNNAKDNDPDTLFTTALAPLNNQVIINYDLGSAKTISLVRVLGYRQTSNASGVSFRIESDDNAAFTSPTTFGSAFVLTPGNIAVDVIFEATATAQFWRVIANQNHDATVELAAFDLFVEDDLGFDSSTNASNYALTNFASTDQTFDHPETNLFTLDESTATGVSFTSRGRTNYSSNRTPNGSAEGVLGTLGVTGGKWYYEIDRTVIGSTGRGALFGFAEIDVNLSNPGIDTAKSFTYNEGGGGKFGNGASGPYGDSWGAFSTGEGLAAVALDMDNNTMEFFVDGVSQGIAFSTGMKGKTLYPVVLISHGGGVTSALTTWEINSGAFGFRHNPPAGFLPITKQNIIAAEGLNNSMRFEVARNMPLRRTPITDGNRTTWTFSTWIKGGTSGLMSAGISGISPNDNYTRIFIDSTGELNFEQFTGLSFLARKTTTAVLRDPTAWYHIVATWDTTNPIAEERIRIYINGIRITDFINNTNPALNTPSAWNSTIGTGIAIGRLDATFNGEYDGYLAETINVDGQALEPTAFGEFNIITGDWTPLCPTETGFNVDFGQEGFYLRYDDAENLGKNSIVLGNEFTTVGIVPDDKTKDVPFNNYCVLNPFDSTVILSNGNLIANGFDKAARGTFAIPPTLKWYWEATIVNSSSGGFVNNEFIIGVADRNAQQNGAGITTTTRAYGQRGVKFNNVSETAYGATYTVADIISVLVDSDIGTIEFFKNGVSQGIAFSDLIATEWFPSIAVNNATSTIEINFGQRPFKFPVPAGALTLNAANLPDPIIPNPRNFFYPALYTGNGTTQSITNVGFQPDLAWIKQRSSPPTSHALFDSVRGPTNLLSSDNLNNEVISPQSLLSFDSSGFSLGNDSIVNASGLEYNSWNWKEGTTPGFDIVTYTGNGISGTTISHNLGAVPALMIIKDRVATTNWQVYHQNIIPNNSLKLNTNAAETGVANPFANTAPDASVFTVAGDGAVFGSNTNGNNYVNYLWSEVEGFSRFGSYVGNGSNDGPFVYLGFQPTFIMLKSSTSANSNGWEMFDTSRSQVNPIDSLLSADVDTAEFFGGLLNDRLDITANGFKIITSNNSPNASGQTYVFAAFAESPFKSSTAFGPSKPPVV